MKHFLVEYTLPYEHIVRVGVKARNATAAEAAARTAFDAGTIWDNAPRMPLLYDDYEESGDQALEFKATEVPAWPAADCSVAIDRQFALSFRMVALLRALVSDDPDLPACKAAAQTLLEKL